MVKLNFVLIHLDLNCQRKTFNMLLLLIVFLYYSIAKSLKMSQYRFKHLQLNGATPVVGTLYTFFPPN